MASTMYTYFIETTKNSLSNFNLINVAGLTRLPDVAHDEAGGHDGEQAEPVVHGPYLEVEPLRVVFGAVEGHEDGRRHSHNRPSQHDAVCVERPPVRRRLGEDDGGDGGRRAGEEEDAGLLVAGVGREEARHELVGHKPE